MEWISDFVRVNGGGLCIFGERNDWKNPKWNETPMRDILPVSIVSNWQPMDYNCEFEITERGKLHDLLRTFKDGKKKYLGIEGLKYFETCALVNSIKAGAVNLANIVMGDKKVPCLVVQQYGQERFYLLVREVYGN